MPPKDDDSVDQRSAKRQKSSVVEHPPPNRDIFMGLKKLSASQKVKWKKMDNQKRNLDITRFLDIDRLDDLGFGVQVRQLMKRAGLEHFMEKSAAVYKRYTLEFLSTLELVEIKGVSSIRFHLNDKVRTLSYAEVRELFGVLEPHGEFNENDHMARIFFFELTGFTLTKLDNKAANLTHPAWRLFYRGLSMTFLGKGAPAKLNTSDVALLRTALPNSSTIPDWIDVFFARCISYAQQDKGHIPVGGMITLIVEKFTKNHPEEVGKIGGPYYYDTNYLCRYEGFSALPPLYCGALKYTYGGNLYVICNEGAKFPIGPSPRDWRMPGVVDMESRELGLVGGDENKDAEEVVANRELVNHTPESSTFRDDQFRELMSMLQDRFAFEDREREETRDRIEAIEDEVSTISMNQTLMMTWMRQAEPRDLPPMPTEFPIRMAARQTKRRRRRDSRQAAGSGTNATWQWPPQQPQE